MGHSVDVHAPGLPAERRSLQGDAVWVIDSGRGTLRERGRTLGASLEVELVPGEQGVLVRARPGAAVRVRVHGSEVAEALIPWGDEVFFDDVRLAFLTSSGGAKGRPLVLLSALVVAAAALFATSRAKSIASDPARDPVPPPLHAAGAACSVTGATSAQGRAFDAERAAVAKRERYAFDASDGVAALSLFDEALACFHDAGRIEDARRAGAALEAWRVRLDADYASLVLELRAALAEKRTRDALRAARDLEGLLSAQREHPYAVWLAGVRNDLERSAAKSPKP